MKYRTTGEVIALTGLPKRRIDYLREFLSEEEGPFFFGNRLMWDSGAVDALVRVDGEHETRSDDVGE